jgi:hypothetical protein
MDQAIRRAWGRAVAARLSASACSVVLFTALVVGCSGSANTGGRPTARPSSAGPSALAPATFIGPLTHELRYSNAGFDLRPPGGQTASATWEQAYETCLTGESLCDPKVSPTIALALVTDPNSGEAEPDRSMKPLLDDTLSYVITYVGLPCQPAKGSDPGSRARTVSTAPVTCTVLNFVSAADGKVIYSFQGPNP